MKIIGLDGKEYSWNPSSCQANCSSRSSLHLKAKDLLDEMFPYDRILEELSLSGSRTSRRRGTLRADFFIPNRMLLVEVHGEQHHKFNNFFFADKLSFYKAKARDSEKREWCEINNIKLVEFNYNEDIDEWRTKIK
jgi:hypothetical protein|tara:strand:+ start:6352 stop:6759 length:408 start_codon:yes stop_codon:yes gene_type:complete